MTGHRDGLADARALITEYEAASNRERNYGRARFADLFYAAACDMVRVIGIAVETVSDSGETLAGVMVDVHENGQQRAAMDIAKLIAGRGCRPASMVLDEVEEQVITVLEKGQAQRKAAPPLRLVK